MKDVAPRHRDFSQDHLYSPFFTSRRELDRLCEDMFQGALAGRDWPRVEMAERDQDIIVTAELPGLKSKDIDISIDAKTLTLRGEKRSQHDDLANHYSERFYGRFERRLRLSSEVDEDTVKAAYKDGVLTVTLRKKLDGRRGAKRIQIEG
jgi:HSP20 family protein